MSKRENCILYNKQKIQVFSLVKGFIFILWYENYHISLVATVFIFMPLDENKHVVFIEKS
jgi:hypothetical protein